MALSFKLSVALLLAVLAAAAATAAAAGGCQKNKKITVQNLCGHDLPLTLTRLANSDPIFGDNTNVHVLRHGTHAEFPVCWWTGRLDAPGAPQTEFHLGVDGGAWYMAPNAQPGQAVPVTVTPHTTRGALQGHCPAVGCPRHGVCFQHAVPGGNCHNVDEIKIIYCSP
ncbi:uncharacterized protein LOC133904365 [Phragmites australis]|uniref:uncharacterized protein LOC133904365 n=1 Tax=Phragmites australis TaxID=29695 RepID=UPI002D796F70|nr:uncharacterized protein LOC133904365 [Phragmites australis]